MKTFILTVLLIGFRLKNSIQLLKQQQNNKQLVVYLAYANNPFGQSTRYQFNNDSVNLPKFLKPNKRIQKLTLIKHNKSILIDRQFIDEETRTKRDVTHLYNMVNCATGCNPLIYKGYGCYCGFLGAGYAVDGIDRCCQIHDWCYDTSDCPMFLEYFIPYLWKCYQNKPVCAFDQAEWSCAKKLCECDRRLSECLKNYPCPQSRAICNSSPWRFFQNILMSV